MKGPKCDLIYGASRTYKTTQLAKLAEYIWEKTGKKTRIVHCDLGGYAVLDPYIEAGMIEIWRLNDEADIIYASKRAAEGYWPVTKDGKRVLTKDGLDQIGGYAFEGITSISTSIYNYFKNKGLRLSQDQMFSYEVGEGNDKIKFGGGSQSHIFEAQNRTVGLINDSARIPGVLKVVWTALEAKGLDDNKQPVYGPAGIGKALTDKLGAMFGNMLHMEMLVTDKGLDPKTKQAVLDTRPVMYLKPHADPMTKIPFTCGVRSAIEFSDGLPEYYDPPDLKKLYEGLDKAESKGVERIKAMMARKPEPVVA